MHFPDFNRTDPAAPTVTPEEAAALRRRQDERIRELRAKGFRALAQWFSENPGRLA